MVTEVDTNAALKLLLEDKMGQRQAAEATAMLQKREGRAHVQCTQTKKILFILLVMKLISLSVSSSTRPETRSSNFDFCRLRSKIRGKSLQPSIARNSALCSISYHSIIPSYGYEKVVR